jgi:UDP-N-acetylmuramate dehydrogenase
LKKKNSDLAKWLDLNDVSYVINYDLKKKSWLKCGGIANLFITPDSFKKTENLAKYLNENKIDFYPVGNLSNTLIRDGQIYTPIINLKNIKEPIVKLDDNENYILLKVSSGLSIFKLVSYISNNLHISGLEGMIGIPETIGGAMLTNASSYDSCISEFLFKLNYLNENGEIITLKKNEIRFGWRSSIFQELKRFIITEVYFKLPKDNIKSFDQIKKRIDFVKNHRQKYQEKEYPNLGSLYATKNLYYELSKLSLVFLFLYIFYLIGTKIIYLFLNEQKLLSFRKFIVKFYSLYFKIDKRKFLFSEKTINCLVNKGSEFSDDAIETINILERKIKGRIKIENNIIIDID